MRPSIKRANEQLDPRQQLANTPPPQSTIPGLHPVSIHQMMPPKWASNCSLLLIYRPRKDERLSWPSRLNCSCSGRFTYIVVTRRLQAERRTGSVRRPKTGVLPTVLRNQPRTGTQATHTVRERQGWRQPTNCSSEIVYSLCRGRVSFDYMAAVVYYRYQYTDGVAGVCFILTRLQFRFGQMWLVLLQ